MLSQNVGATGQNKKKQEATKMNSGIFVRSTPIEQAFMHQVKCTCESCDKGVVHLIYAVAVPEVHCVQAKNRPIDRPRVAPSVTGRTTLG